MSDMSIVLSSGRVKQFLKAAQRMKLGRGEVFTSLQEIARRTFSKKFETTIRVLFLILRMAQASHRSMILACFQVAYSVYPGPPSLSVTRTIKIAFTSCRFSAMMREDRQKYRERPSYRQEVCPLTRKFWERVLQSGSGLQSALSPLFPLFLLLRGQ